MQFVSLFVAGAVKMTRPLAEMGIKPVIEDSGSVWSGQSCSLGSAIVQFGFGLVWSALGFGFGSAQFSRRQICICNLHFANN